MLTFPWEESSTASAYGYSEGNLALTPRQDPVTPILPLKRFLSRCFLFYPTFLVLTFTCVKPHKHSLFLFQSLSREGALHLFPAVFLIRATEPGYRGLAACENPSGASGQLLHTLFSPRGVKTRVCDDPGQSCISALLPPTPPLTHPGSLFPVRLISNLLITGARVRHL